MVADIVVVRLMSRDITIELFNGSTKTELLKDRAANRKIQLYVDRRRQAQIVGFVG